MHLPRSHHHRRGDGISWHLHSLGGRLPDYRPDGHVTRRLPLPLEHAFMDELDKAQRLSIAHGKWLVDQHLDHGRELFQKAA